MEKEEKANVVFALGSLVCVCVGGLFTLSKR